MGEYEKAVEIFLEARDELPDNSYLSYNLALANYQIGDYGKSIYYARDAFYHDPLNEEYRSLVVFIEQKGEIIYPIGFSFNLYPDAFLFLLMIFVNIASFIGVIYLVKKRAIYFIVSVLLFSLSILTLGGLGFSIVQKDRQVGIIQEQVSVKKIPLAEAETVVEMKPGESVLVKGDSDNFLFINTGTGIKGWIDSSNIMILED
jgi:tetratricopeptide (TPR) repeat protein